MEVRYQRGGAFGVQGVGFDIPPGTGLLITGDKGSGKSSVLRAVLGLAGPGGDITVLGAPPGDPADVVGQVVQAAYQIGVLTDGQCVGKLTQGPFDGGQLLRALGPAAHV